MTLAIILTILIALALPAIAFKTKRGFQIVALTLLVMALPRPIYSVRVFFCDPRISWDLELSETAKNQILTCVRADDHRNISPVTFSVFAFIEQFVGLEEYGTTVDIKRDGELYVVLVDRSNDSSARQRWQYKVTPNFQIVEKSPLKLPIY